MVVDIFIPCFIDQVFPETGFNMVKVLEKAGVGVRYNKNQTCCGQIAFNSGFWDHAKSMGEKFIRDFKDCQYVVTPSASCAGMVRNYYDEMFYNSAMHNEYRLLKKNIYEVSDFLVNVLNIRDIGATFNHRVTYHDSCAALREYGLKDEPRILLEHVRGLELVEMQETTTCCGFGGTFSVKHEPISSAMADYKIKKALETGAEFIVSTDASCLMHQQGYIDKHNLPVNTIHIVDILASGWEL
ncbi:MAG: (Fe-S)-binding protein [Bacteroidales bacterium]|nr:(Fe-S)-binding protein [Bacteroidales bacterium]MBK9358539.1 (Fe-S)-binding protein [Bacteroidales bacterium]